MATRYLTLEQFEAELLAMGEPIKWHKCMEQIQEYVIQETTRAFDEERSPDGVPWPTRKPVEYDQRSHGTLLHKSGGLRLSATSPGSPYNIDTLTADESGGHLEWGTEWPYAGVHQEGATIHAAPGKALAIPLTDGAASVKSPTEISGLVRKGKFLMLGDEPWFLLVKKVTIPPRPFIGAGKDNVDAMVNIVQTFLEDEIKYRMNGG